MGFIDYNVIYHTQTLHCLALDWNKNAEFRAVLALTIDLKPREGLRSHAAAVSLPTAGNTSDSLQLLA